MNPDRSYPEEALDHRRLMQIIGASILLMAIVGGAAHAHSRCGRSRGGGSTTLHFGCAEIEKRKQNR